MAVPASLTLAAARRARHAFVAGLAIAILGSILCSAKALVAEVIYRYQGDAIMMLTLRTMFAFPLFAMIAFWKARTEPRLSHKDHLRILFMGLIGYYLSRLLDFLGLQHISTGLERLILLLTPTFVLLIAFFFYKRSISGAEWGTLLLSYLGTVFVFMHDVSVGLGSLLVLAAAVTYALYLLLSGELVQRVGAMRLVAYAMCVSSVACILQFFILRTAGALVHPMAVSISFRFSTPCSARYCRYALP